MLFWVQDASWALWMSLAAQFKGASDGSGRWGGTGPGWCVMGPWEMNPQEASGCGIQCTRGHPGPLWSRSLRVWMERKGGELWSQETRVFISSPRTLCVTLHGLFTSPCCLSFLIYEMGIRILSSTSQGPCVKTGQAWALRWDRLGWRAAEL